MVRIRGRAEGRGGVVERAVSDTPASVVGAILKLEYSALIRRPARVDVEHQADLPHVGIRMQPDVVASGGSVRLDVGERLDLRREARLQEGTERTQCLRGHDRLDLRRHDLRRQGEAVVPEECAFLSFPCLRVV